MMKKVFFLLGIASLHFFMNVPAAQAACSLDRGSRQYPRTVTVSGTTLNVQGQTFDLPASRCTAKQPDGVHTVWCDTDAEANAYDSVIVPLCGSSQELGKANTTCWSCGGDMRCSGLSFGFGETDAFISDPNNRNPVSDGDTNTDQVWRIRQDQIASSLNANGKFVFNGHEYDPPSGDMIVCNANLPGCGASDVACTNARWDEYTLDDVGVYVDGQLIRTWGTGGKVEQILANPGSNPGDHIQAPSALNLSWLGRLGQAITERIAATVRYTSNIHEGMSDFQRIGAISETAAIEPLMPAVLQKQYSPPDAGDKPGRYPLRSSSLYRLCVPNAEIDQPHESGTADNVPLRGATVTEGTVGNDSTNPRFWPQTIAGTRLFTAYWIPGAGAAGVDFVTPNGDPVEFTEIAEEDGRILYDTDPAQVDAAAYECDAVAVGTPLQNVDTEADGQACTGNNPFCQTSEGQGLFNIISASFRSSLFSLTACNPGDDTPACARAPWKIVRSDYLPGDLAVVSQSIGLSADQLHQGMAPVQKNELRADGGSQIAFADSKGGWMRTFLPQKFTQEIEYKDAVAPQGNTLSAGVLGQLADNFNAYPRWLKGVSDAFSCVIDNAIIPSQLQNVTCPWQGDDEPWPGTGDRPIATWAPSSQILTPDFSVPLVQQEVGEAIEEATDGRIPQCVLEAVKYIETGASWQPPSECRINACGAAGPFQITVGVDSTGDPTCKQCGPSWADGSRQCPDGWPGNWPTDSSSPSPCDVNQAAHQATQMLIDKSAYWTQQVTGQRQPLNATDSIQDQQAAIMLGADSYWGTTASVARLGGCTYGEFVYKHCDPSYQCGNPPYSLP